MEEVYRLLALIPDDYYFNAYVSLVKVWWTAINIFCLTIVVVEWWDAQQDLKAVIRAHVDGQHLAIATKNVKDESCRLRLIFVFTIIGLLSFFSPKLEGFHPLIAIQTVSRVILIIIALDQVRGALYDRKIRLEFPHVDTRWNQVERRRT